MLSKLSSFSSLLNRSASMFHCLLGSIPALVMALAGFSAPVSAWQLSDRQAYNNKMALLSVILEGAKQRAVETDDLETLCLVMSIGNDVTELYLQEQTSDQQIRQRLHGMRDDFSACVGLLDSSR